MITEEGQKSESVKILVADDVEMTRFVLRDIIQEMGYEPVLAQDGPEALKLAKQICPQLVILDVSMPEMDGYTVCRQLKECVETREIPVIFISAFDDPADVVEGFELGGEDYITKPIIPEVVKARLRLHLKLHHANEKLQEMNRRLQSSVEEQLRQLEMEKKNILYALIRVARENACYDDNHMERLCYNCRILAEAMQLSLCFGKLISDTFIETLELAAPLCDLGNMAIPVEILQKKGALLPEEQAAMQKHAAIGARILEDIRNTDDDNDFLQMSVEIAHYHHENWDGSGYPCGLKGDEIPLSAQIVAVAGAYCAITESRCYRASFNGEEALAMMERDAGKKYNPAIFEIMQKIHRQLR